MNTWEIEVGICKWIQNNSHAVRGKICDKLCKVPARVWGLPGWRRGRGGARASGGLEVVASGEDAQVRTLFKKGEKALESSKRLLLETVLRPLL